LANLTKLLHVDLKNNRIKFVNHIYNLINLNVIEISFNKIEEINFSNLTKLTTLLMNDNQIENIETISNLNLLNKVDISNNRISKINFKKLTKLTFLNGSKNNIVNIETISSASNMKELYLDSNSIENAKSIESFRELEKLDLSNNKIKSVQFKKFYNLQRVSMSYNELKNIDSLFGLSNLRFINFSNNKIESIHNKLLDSSKRTIFEIDLSHNQLNSIEFDYEINVLWRFYLSFNNLSSIKFFRINNIVHFYLNDNNLNNFNELFENIICNASVDISNNNFDFIDFTDSFRTIRRLIMNNNPLLEITGLNELKSLKRINLNQNNLMLFNQFENKRTKKAISQKYWFIETLYLNVIDLIYNESNCLMIYEFLIYHKIHVNMYSNEQIEQLVKICLPIYEKKIETIV
jgi:Leucine-rich repeat (LRR) protein